MGHSYPLLQENPVNNLGQNGRGVEQRMRKSSIPFCTDSGFLSPKNKIKIKIK